MSFDNRHIADIRKDYRLAALDEDVVGNNPLIFFNKWFAEAQAANVDEVNAMALATVDSLNRPHTRIVLLKGMDDNGFTFFTNYQSNKGKQLNDNPNAALLFFWKELERQVRIEGLIEKTDSATSDEYFQSRPEGSRLGAWASPQSGVINSRDFLEKNYLQYKQNFSSDIPRPPHWGGYKLSPHSIEFWQGRSNRMHDRILFTKPENSWIKQRLAP